MLERYKEKIQSLFAKNVEQTGDKRISQQMADRLIKDNQHSEDEYIGGIEMHQFRYVHVPDETGMVLPGKASAIEEYFRGNTEQLLVQRLGIPEKTAREVIKILGKKRFKVTP